MANENATDQQADNSEEAAVQAAMSSAEPMEKQLAPKKAARSLPQMKPGEDDPRTSGRALRRLLDEDIDSEVDSALSGFEGGSLLEQPKQARPPKPAPDAAPQQRGRRAPPPPEVRLSVRVLSVQPDFVYLDVEGKAEGIVATSQFFDKVPNVGDMVEVVLDRYDAGQDVTLYRRPGASREVDWGELERGMIVDASVKGVNKGGLEVTVNGIRGFLPAGQVDIYHVENLSTLMGQTLRCRIMELDKAAKNIVVSRKMILEEERVEKAKATLASLEQGQIRDAVVRKLMDFGVFVDLGGVDGLVHVSQMSWTKVNHPSDILSVGQHVKVLVLSVDKETKKISLSLRQLSDSPWKKVVQSYPQGAICQAKITRLADFGAFAELEPGIEGLIHISELSTRRVSRASTVVKEGEVVTVKVLEVDPERQRLSLSMKAVSAAAEAEKAEEARQAAEEEARKADEAAGKPAAAPKKPSKPLKGGTGNSSGPLFG